MELSNNNENRRHLQCCLVYLSALYMSLMYIPHVQMCNICKTETTSTIDSLDAYNKRV